MTSLRPVLGEQTALLSPFVEAGVLGRLLRPPRPPYRENAADSRAGSAPRGGPRCTRHPSSGTYASR